MTKYKLGTYEELAQEYYNSNRHPTCANFREGSAILFRKWALHAPTAGQFCEVGPGKSLLAELASESEFSYGNLLLVDSSYSMLMHSKCFAVPDMQMIIGEATALPIHSGSVNFLASSLGDPYNVFEFWNEARRVLAPNGVLIFTTPSYEWAEAFRNGEPALREAAEFVLANGRRIYVPSYVTSREIQFDVIRQSGLEVVDFATVNLADLVGFPISEKLLVGGDRLGVVTGYVCRRP